MISRTPSRRHSPLHAQRPAPLDRSAHDAAQDVAAILVGGDHASGDGKCPAVVGDTAGSVASPWRHKIELTPCLITAMHSLGQAVLACS